MRLNVPDIGGGVAVLHHQPECLAVHQPVRMLPDELAVAGPDLGLLHPRVLDQEAQVRLPQRPLAGRPVRAGGAAHADL